MVPKPAREPRYRWPWRKVSISGSWTAGLLRIPPARAFDYDCLWV
jgi:hypothetical protein